MSSPTLRVWRLTIDPSKQDQWQKLFGYVLGYQATWVIDVGLKAGLFAAIADNGPIAEDALGAKLGGLDQRYLQVWCRAAYAFELVDWNESDGYRLAPHMRQLLLVPVDPQFLGGRLQFYAALYEDFKAFPKYLKEGGSWPRAEHDPFLLETLESMTKPDAVTISDAVLPQVPALVRRLEQDLGKPVRATESWEECLRGADVMVEASRLERPEPHLLTSWVEPGCLVIPYGTMSAVELTLTDVMDKVVVDDWGQARSGSFGALRAHVDTGRLDEESLHAELCQIVVGDRPGRESDEERILFWHRGLSLSDIALGHALLEKAHRLGVGQTLDVA